MGIYNSRQLAGYVTELDIFELFCINNSLPCMQIRDFSIFNLKYRNSEDGTEYTELQYVWSSKIRYMQLRKDKCIF